MNGPRHRRPAIASCGLAAAAVLGFGAIAGTAMEIAKIVFFVAIILFLISLVFAVIGGRRPVA